MEQRTTEWIFDPRIEGSEPRNQVDWHERREHLVGLLRCMQPPGGSARALLGQDVGPPAQITTFASLVVDAEALNITAREQCVGLLADPIFRCPHANRQL
jgi:hypothetical protein